MFKRLTCCVLGHKPFPKKPPAPKPESSEGVPLGTIATYHGTGGMTLMANPTIGGMTWVNNDKTLEVNRGPFNAQFAICARCQNVYWIVTPYGPTIAHVDNLPELKAYHEWRAADAQETKQRRNNPLAEKLYQQYRVALKLVGDSQDGS